MEFDRVVVRGTEGAWVGEGSVWGFEFVVVCPLVLVGGGFWRGERRERRR